MSGRIILSFDVAGVAQPGGSKRALPAHGRRFARVVDDNPKARPWKDRVAIVAAAAMETVGLNALEDGPLLLELEVYLPRPRSHFGTGRNAGTLKASAPRYHTQKPDVLKLARTVEDALTGVVYRDDAQIAEERLFKSWGEPARACVSLYRL